MHRKNSDLLIIQETHSVIENENVWIKDWGGEAVFSHGTNMSRGIAIFYKKNIVLTNIYTANDGRTIICDVVENDRKVTICAIYAPNQDCPAYFENIMLLLQSRSENKIIVGDFNLVLDVELDRKNTYCNNNKSKEVVENIMDQFSMCELWRVLNGENREYSWLKTGNIQKASRIDFALVSRGIDQYVNFIGYFSSVKTDHRALYMVVELQSMERGVGYWKFNTSLLGQKEFIEKMNQEIDTSIRLLEGKNPIEKWESLKVRIKKCAVKFSRNLTSQNNLVISSLSEKVNSYEMSFPLTQQECQIYENTKLDLDEKMLEKAKGAIFRSKIKWYEEGEKSTKYFFSLEKSQV